MNRVIRRAFTWMLLLALLAGCGGPAAGEAPAVGTDPALAPVGASASGAPSPSPGPSPSAGTPAPDPLSQAATVDLTAELARRPTFALQPTYQWAHPAKGNSYDVLPQGLLLTWPDRQAGKEPFVMHAYEPDGQIRWSWSPGLAALDVLSVTIAADGKRIAVRDQQTAHLLDAADGKAVGTMQVEDFSLMGFGFAAQGKYLYKWSQTPSAVYRNTVGLYPFPGDSEPTHGASGRIIAVSPFHDMAIGLSPEGVELEIRKGALATIQYPTNQFYYHVETSADGSIIWIWSPTRGLEAFGSNAQQRWQRSDVTDEHIWLAAPYAKVIWLRQRTGEFQLLGATGETERRLTVSDDAFPQAALPGGELAIRLWADGIDCLVTPAGELLGCAPFIGVRSYVASPTGSFFWTSDDVTIKAYQR